MEREQLPCPAFIKKSEATPLQAADWLAWEMFNANKTKEIRPSLKRLVGSLPIDDLSHGIFGVNALERTRKAGNVPLRAALPAGTVIVHHSSPRKPRKRTIFEKQK